MMLPAVILVQALPELPPVNFDLGKMPAPPDCSQGSGNAIVVCANRRKPLPEPLSTGPYSADILPKADVGLFGKVRGSLHGAQTVVGGIPSNAVKLTVNVPF